MVCNAHYLKSMSLAARSTHKIFFSLITSWFRLNYFVSRFMIFSPVQGSTHNIHCHCYCTSVLTSWKMLVLLTIRQLLMTQFRFIFRLETKNFLMIATREVLLRSTKNSRSFIHINKFVDHEFPWTHTQDKGEIQL